MKRLRGSPELAPLIVLYSTLGLFLFTLIPRLIGFDETGGLTVRHEHLWSDWPLHIGMLRRFSDNGPSSWLTQHPMLGGEPLRYPFVAAMISGLLVRAGASVPIAIALPSIVFFALLLLGMYRLSRSLMGGRWLALLPIALFFFAAGPGFTRWFADIRALGVDALLCPPHEYGRVDDYGWYAGNFVVGMLLPQRAFLPGMTLGVWLLYGLTVALPTDAAPRRKLLLLCGIGAGLLPIVHLHTLIALTFLGAGLAAARLGRRPTAWRDTLLGAALPAAVLAGAFWIFLLRPAVAYPNFVSFKPGFVAAGAIDWIKLWWRVWGLFLPVAFAGIVLRGRLRIPGDAAVGVALGGLALWVTANLILFQPIAWDNSKLFLWVYFALSFPAAHLLAVLWRRRVGGRVPAIALVLFLTLTGLADLTALARTDRHNYQILNPDDVALGNDLRARTGPDDIIATGMDISNAALTWSGRPIFLGFGGWMPNFGYNHERREADLHAIYAGKPETPELLRRWNIRAVLIGPGERAGWSANEPYFAAHYKVLAQRGSVTVYDVR